MPTYTETVYNLNVCPFCGSDRITVEVPDFGRTVQGSRSFQVICKSCNARGPQKNTVVKAVNRWNAATATAETP